MTHIKVAVSATCENQNIQSHIEKVTHNVLLFLGYVDVVRDDRWDYLLRFTAVEKADAFIEIEVKYNWKRSVTHQPSDSADITIDQVNLGGFRMPLEELSEFCQQQVQTFTKWHKRGVLGQAHVLALLGI